MRRGWGADRTPSSMSTSTSRCSALSPVKYFAPPAPMLTLDLQITEASSREVYIVALTIPLMIDAARRTLRRSRAEAQLVELFGAPKQ